LSTNPENPTPPTPSGTKPFGRKKLLVAIAVLAVATLLIVTFLASAMLSKPTEQNAWLFRGAYAKYDGSTSVMGFGFEFSVKMEVVDFNTTHVYMSTSFSMSSNIVETIEQENSTWVPLSQVGFTNAFSESNITRTYDATINFGSLGTRSCTIYEIATDGPTLTVYVDKIIGWPLKMTVSMTGEGTTTLSLDINLVDTNISGLK
jgi:hypothetical protein